MKLEILLQKYFNSHSFRSTQKEVIETVLGGDDVFVRFPTGMGKSLCYQLPALVMPGCVVVVSPLIALMKDQVDGLNQKGISAIYLNSTVSPQKYEQIKTDCIKNKYKIIYISPEGLIKEFKSLICNLNISLFAIDEAHTIMQWGFDFRPQYNQLHILKKQFPNVPIMAVTASVTREAKKQTIQILGIKNAKDFSAPLYRSNISLSVKNNINSTDKILEIQNFVNKYTDDAGIIFCNTRRIANSIANKLKYRNINALAYHAGMSKKERESVQQKFIYGEVKVICATIAFGMGIDKQNIRWVIHYNLPQNIETYYQEVGRIGRDGRESEALLFYNNEDTKLIETFALRSGNIEVNIDKLQHVTQYAKARKCRWQYILDYFAEDEAANNCSCDICREQLSKNL